MRTAPVAVVDPRKEHNKLRLQMTGGAVHKGKDRSSPSSYGTPKGLRSPLASPLVGDSIQARTLLPLSDPCAAGFSSPRCLPAYSSGPFSLLVHWQHAALCENLLSMYWKHIKHMCAFWQRGHEGLEGFGIF